ncbi:hypothetical protein GQX73_g5135 [Xylaria multiplex]|uniref:Uncharacterized protein n=1 Tax=Xylaria multiplex TaxID=323545 RepID=A0A7C8N7E2_9PEZI|nr:hypothetical protein GQX73_g5135 [Xylaria multiplex]
MFISQVVVASCLLALSAASPAKYPFSYETASKYFVHPTPKTFVKPTPKWPIVHTPKYIATPPPVPTPTPALLTTRTYPASSYEALPGTCYSTLEAYGYVPATVKTHSCYTRTSFFPAANKQPPSALPHALLPPDPDGPGLRRVHQGVERDGAVRDGLLSNNGHRVQGRPRGALPDVRPVPHPDRVDHVHDGLRRHAHHHRGQRRDAGLPDWLPRMKEGLAADAISKGACYLL